MCFHELAAPSLHLTNQTVSGKMEDPLQLHESALGFSLVAWGKYAPSIVAWSNAAGAFLLERSNHRLGSLWPVSWLSPDEFLLGELPETALLPVSGLMEASLARRWCRRVTDSSGEALRGIG